MRVLVIGAGVIGLTTAYFLQCRGFEVSVVDRADGVGRGASGGHGTLGWTLAAGSARLVADAIAGARSVGTRGTQPTIDPRPFAYG